MFKNKMRYFKNSAFFYSNYLVYRYCCGR